MKSNVWDIISDGEVRPRPKRPKRKSVAAILKAAYHQHVRDKLTRRAVRRVLH